MISTKETPDTVVKDALAQMFLDPVWGAALERACDTGLAALQAKTAKFATALIARERDLDVAVDAVTVAVLDLAQEIHPESKAVIQALSSPASRSELDPDDGADQTTAWDEGWAASERRRALMYLCSRAADGDLPHLQDEYAEVYEAVRARDRDRYSAAIRSLVKAALLTLRREGRLLPETSSSSAGAPERDGDPGSSSAA